jgi:hypothetical protein
MVDFYMKRGDLLPTFDVVLLDGNEPVDVSSGVDSVKFYARDANGVLVVNGGTMTNIGTGSDGQVRYAWVAGDTDKVGEFSAEVVVTWTAGPKEQTFPNNNNIIIKVLDDVQ